MNKVFMSSAAALLLVASTASAQNIDGAINAYKAGDYTEAAIRFHEVLKFDTDEGNQAEAEYGLAQSFMKMGLYLPAVKYFENIIQSGNSHTYYFKAFEGILDAGDALDDDLKVPAVLDKAYGKPLAKMEKLTLYRIHYVLGELSYRQGKPGDAKSFLKTVTKGHPSYAKAQYVLALMKMGLGAKNKDKPRLDEAATHFRNIMAEIPDSTGDKAKKKLRILAVFGLSRVLYEEAAQMEEDNPERKAKLDEALRNYETIERLSPEWGEALFERGWTHFLANEYGQSLGIMHTLQSPYFDDRYQPELHVQKAIVYYFNCHYDRVYKTLKIFEDEYKPQLEELKKVNGEDRDTGLWYELMKKSSASSRLSSGPEKTKGDGLIPVRIAGHMAKDSKWTKLDGTLTEIEKEIGKVKGNKTWADGPLAEEVLNLLDDARKSFIKITGKYVQGESKKQEETLQGFLNRGTLVRLETASAEQGWLEAGRALQENVTRRRLPRPFIPDDTYIFWSWRGEYWADEVGYYRFAVKSECID